MSDLPMIIDCFAGGGGASTGIELALGRSPDVAINHSEAALALHQANHPETLHLDSNIWDVDPASVTKGRKVGLVWASPDCKHFSKAKGSSLCDRNIRDLAWVVHRWARLPKAERPDVILLENVEEFITWGPICEQGQPIKEFAGQTYELWVRQLRDLGYKVQWKELRACDYGAPTIRKRLFIVARCDGRPIVWPKPTHGDPKSAAVRKGKLKPWRGAAEIIDWSIPCPSIFDTSEQIKEKLGLRAKRPLAENTLARIARGMARYVLEAERPFLVSLKGTDRRDSSIYAPHPTVLAGGYHSALIAPSITRFNSGATGSDMSAPVSTVTANSFIKRPGGAAPLGIAAPYLASYYSHSEGRGKRASNPADPLATVVTENRHAVVAPVLTYAQQGGACRDARDPHHTICASRKDQNALLAATMVQTGYGERQGQAPRALDVEQPLGTVVAGGAKHAPVAAFLAQHHTGVTGHDAREPLSTIAASGSHQTPIAAFFAKYYGTGDGARTDDPLHTVTVQDRFAHVQADMAAPPFGPEHVDKARQVAALLRRFGVWEGDGDFVTLSIDGTEFVVVDIGMRMLTPRELFRAQGFPDDYVIDGVWEGLDTDAPTFREFTKSVQVSCCGNSVSPPVAEALARANAAHLAAEQFEALEEVE